MSAIFDSNSPYGSSSNYSQDPYSQRASSSTNPTSNQSQQPQPQPGLQFYSSGTNSNIRGGISPGPAYSDGYASGSAGRPSLEGNMNNSMNSTGGNMNMMNAQMGFWSAFGTGGFPDEPGLLEELGINFQHIVDKSLTVLNPIHSYSSAHPKDAHLMDDADLAGPLIFCFLFGVFLLLAGKSQFGYIYGVVLLGDLSIYLLLNMMSEGGIDAYRVASVLGYCLLPLVLLSAISTVTKMDGPFGYLLSPLFILWCSSSASGIFVSILRLSEQRFLVAYPLGLFYTSFALLSVFNIGGK